MLFNSAASGTKSAVEGVGKSFWHGGKALATLGKWILAIPLAIYGAAAHLIGGILKTPVLREVLGILGIGIAVHEITKSSGKDKEQGKDDVPLNPNPAGLPPSYQGYPGMIADPKAQPVSPYAGQGRPVVIIPAGSAGRPAQGYIPGVRALDAASLNYDGPVADTPDRQVN